jgi:hypothetical protein
MVFLGFGYSSRGFDEEWFIGAKLLIKLVGTWIEKFI